MTSQLAEPSPLEAGPIGALLDWTLEQPVELRRLPVHLLSEEQKAAALERVQRGKAKQAAYEAELVLSMAADRPARLDPPPGTPGARRGSAGGGRAGPSLRRSGRHGHPGRGADRLRCGGVSRRARPAGMDPEQGRGLPAGGAFTTGWTFTMDPDGTLHVTTPSRHHPVDPPTRPAPPDAPAEEPPPPPPPDPPPF